MESMLYRMELEACPGQADPVGRRTAVEIRETLGLPAESARMVKVLTLEGVSADEVRLLAEKATLHDPVLQKVSLEP